VIFRRSILSFLLLLVACSISSAIEVGKIKIPADATFGGRAVQAGLYTLEIDDTADKPYLRLLRNEQMIAAEVAIVLPARGPGKTSVSITKVGKKELIRIRARHGDHWYFAYLETTRKS
jgi:hypothetical protein